MAQKYLGGERRKDGAKDRAQWEGRCHFLRAVEKVAPKCLKDLEGTPIEAFKDAYDKTRPNHHVRNRPVDPLVLPSPPRPILSGYDGVSRITTR